MAKTANLYVRIEPELKEQAEKILAALGISPSLAITMFYRQVIIRRGLPFEVVLPANPPVDVSKGNGEQLDAQLEKGHADLKAGMVHDAENVFPDLSRGQGL